MIKNKITIGDEIISEVKRGEIERLEQVIENREQTINEFSTQLNAYKNNRVICLESIINPWIYQDNVISKNDELYLDDPIFDCVLLQKEMIPLYYHPLVQRLKYVKQLSFSYPFPSATHSRLSHSLGVYFLMEEALTKILIKGVMYSTEIEKYKDPDTKLEKKRIWAKEEPLNLTLEQKKDLYFSGKAAALLHDIGHGPFSHTIDRYIGYLMEIEDYADKEFCISYLDNNLKTYLQNNKFNFEGLRIILDRNVRDKKSYYKLIAGILDSDCDVDRMDYLVRDSHFTGIPAGKVYVKKIIENMVVTIDKENIMNLAFREAAVPYIKHFLFARISMYTNCYEHSQKIASERMIVKAVDDFRLNVSKPNDDLELMKLLTDEQLFSYILANSNSTNACNKLISSLMTGSIFEEIYSVNTNDFAPLSRPYGIEKYYKGLMDDNEPLKTVFIQWVQMDEEKYAKEAKLSEEDAWKVAIYIPPFETNEKTGIHINILHKLNDRFQIIRVDQYSDVYSLYKQIMHERMKIRIFVDQSLTEEQKNAIKTKAEQEFGTSKM